MYKLISVVTKECDICERVKLTSYKHDNDNRMIAKDKLERISTDIYGPFKLNDYKISCSGETVYILSITDIYTRYTKLHLLEKIGPKAVIEKIKDWCIEFKTPKYIVSDNRKQIKNKKFSNFAKENSIKQIFVPEYTPSSKGVSERLNKPITGILIIFRGRSIEEIIREAEHCINSNYSRFIKGSSMFWFKGFDFYNLLKFTRIRRYVIPLNIKEKRFRYKAGNLVYKRQFNASKLESRLELIPRRIEEVDKKGYWVKLADDTG